MENVTQAIWEHVLSDMQKKVSSANFLTIFKQTTLVSLDDGIATIATPSVMISEMLQKRFRQDMKASFDNHTGEDVELLFITKPLKQKTAKQPEVAQAEEPGPLFAPPSEKPKPLSVGHLPRVRPDYTFPNFAVSGSNQLAYTAAVTVSEHVGTSYNPLFLYGPVGVGKTHLMHAIANEVYQRQPDKKIIYLTSEEFTNDVVEAIRTNTTAQMKRRFRSAVLLLIDDIQFIEGKERVQEELFHTFNILIDSGAQICLSSDRPPHEIKRLEKRLSSRFAGGLTVDIEPPDFELKTAILLKKAEKYGQILPIDVAKLISERVEDARSLEGLLLRVMTIAMTTQEPISIELALKALGVQQEEQKKHLHADDVIKNVCEFYDIKPTQLKGPKREAGLVRARQVTMYVLKHELGLTYVEIGNLLGGRDHTTIIHGVEKIEALVDKKATVSQDIVGITRALRE